MELPFSNSQIHQDHFKYIYDLEFDLIFTVFSKPDIINEFNIASNIFSNDLSKHIFDSIVHIKENNINMSMSTVFEISSKKNPLITYNIIQNNLNNKNVISDKKIQNTIQMIKTNSMRVKLFKIASSLSSSTVNTNLDISSIIYDLEFALDELKLHAKIEGKGLNNVLDSILDNVGKINRGETLSYLRTGVPTIDKRIAITMDNIVLIGGAAKHGKSKFTTYLVRKLLENNKDLMCQWHSYEDDENELGLNFVYPYAMMNGPEINQKGKKLSEEQLERVQLAVQRARSFNIDIHDKPLNIKDISIKFLIFVKKNPDKKHILVIDNASLILDEGNDRDDKIMNTLSSLRQKTKALIFVIHHFNDEQMSLDRLSTGFRPLIKDLKGREAYRRVPKMVLLINYPFMYSQILNAYRPYKDILKHMYIVDVAANRLMPLTNDDHEEETSDDSLIYFYADLNYNIFIPLNELR